VWCTCLLTLLITLALSGCTPKVLSGFAASTEDSGINSVATVLLPAGQIAKSVTLVATERATSAGGATSMAPDQGVLELSETDSGRSVDVTLGTTIVLHLTSQRSTGYAWVVDEVDNGILVPDGEPQYTAASNLRGAEESMVWKFKSVGAGATTLKLIYARAFEEEQPPLKTFELTVEVGSR
jgi:inhibitor of cysteine peptidase